MAIDTPDTPTASSAGADGRLTHCPTCGMKIARDDLSLCSYCGSPVQLGRETTRSSELQKRLGKMPEHKNYEAALAWQPTESLDYVAGMTDRGRGRWCALGAVVLGAWAVSLLTWGGAWAVPAVLAVLLAAAAVLLTARGARRCREATSMPLLKRAAIVHERRSETTYQGGRGATVYYFKLEFAGGGEGEFRQPGRGSQFEPLVNGNTGIAYTRGQELLDFKVLRV